jgi:hypothetical protein
MSNPRKRPAFLTEERKIFSIPATKVGNQPGMEVAISENGIQFKEMGGEMSEPIEFRELLRRAFMLDRLKIVPK